jgi:hypothetical protein
MKLQNLTQGDFLSVVVSFKPNPKGVVHREGQLSEVTTNGDTLVRVEAVAERIETAEKHIERAKGSAPPDQQFEVIQVPIV